jgi:threonine dehydrogenase-like Zn-dependent dehydrogenase
MKALVCHGPGQKAWEDVPDPTIQHPTDATHHFSFDQVLEAYETFADAADTKALKVVIRR